MDKKERDKKERDRKDFIDFLIKERESLLDIPGCSPRDRYSKPKKRGEPTFAEIIYDATFEVVGLLRLKEGEFAHCCFCGNRMKYPVLLRRLTDRSTWKVGKICIGRVGLELTGKEKTVVSVEGTQRYKEVEEEQPKVEEDEEDYFSLDDVFED